MKNAIMKTICLTLVLLFLFSACSVKSDSVITSNGFQFSETSGYCLINAPFKASVEETTKTLGCTLEHKGDSHAGSPIEYESYSSAPNSAEIFDTKGYFDAVFTEEELYDISFTAYMETTEDAEALYAHIVEEFTSAFGKPTEEEVDLNTNFCNWYHEKSGTQLSVAHTTNLQNALVMIGVTELWRLNLE